MCVIDNKKEVLLFVITMYILVNTKYDLVDYFLIRNANFIIKLHTIIGIIIFMLC